MGHHRPHNDGANDDHAGQADGGGHGLSAEYAERYDWLARQFKDWAFTFCSSFLYYEDYDKIDETTRDLYRQGHGGLRRRRAHLPHRATGQADHRVGFPFPDVGRPDDVQLPADGRQDHPALL